MLILSLLSAASGADMTLDWTGKTVRYHGEALIQRYAPIQLLAIQNASARANTLMLASDLTCTGSALKKGWALSCAIDEISLQAEVYAPAEAEALSGILTEYELLLSRATIQIELTADGRIRVVDLEGVDKTDDRMREIHEILRLMMRRMVAPLDQQLPRKGVAETGDSWKHKNSAIAFELFSKYGTMGGSVLKYTVASTDGGQVVVQSDGHGNIGLSNAGATYGFAEGSASSEASSGTDSTGYSSGSATGSLYNTVAFTTGRFDVAGSQWLYVESSAQGQHNQSVNEDTFVQAAWLGQISADGAIEGAEGPVAPQ